MLGPHSLRYNVLRQFVLYLTAMHLAGGVSWAENWPRFRGPAGTGISDQQGLPIEWSSDSAYDWKTPLPGLGHSSPCVWENHVFVTSSQAEGRQRQLHDIDARTGRIRWTRSTDSKTHPQHGLNSYASGTPTTDGKQVYVLFVSNDQVLLRAYDFQGKPAWQHDLGPFVQKQDQVHGSGTSPIVFDDLVILANQQDGSSAIIALDAVTGKPRWKSDRQVRSTAHSTPLVFKSPDHPPQLFFSNTGDGISSLNPRSGELVFRADILPARCVGSPLLTNGLILATCGGGGRGRYMAAIPIGKRGELTADDAAWTRDRILPYVPTPIAYRDLLFLWGDDGVVVCLRAKTGEEQWTARVGGNYSGSPVCVDGKLYCVDRSGTVVVLAAADEYQLLGRSQLGEGCHSTPAIAAGRMFIRGFKHLFCLKAMQ